MKRLITNNIGLKILALVFGICLWLISININDPLDSAKFHVEVQMKNEVAALGAGTYTEILDDTDKVEVIIRASRTNLDKIRASSIVAVADLLKINSDNRVPIEVSVPDFDGNIDDIKLEHGYVEVKTEPLAVEQKIINVKTQNDPAEGHIVGKVITNQNALTISGPRSIVSKISYASVVANVGGVNSDINIQLPIVLYDEDDIRIPTHKLTMSIDSVITSISILNTKKVPIEVHAYGEPAIGYGTSGIINVSPDTITIAGKPASLDSIRSIVVDNALDITGMTEDYTVSINVEEYLNDNLVLGDSEDDGIVYASAHIAKLERGLVTIPITSISMLKVPDGYIVKLDEEMKEISVPVTGIKEALDSIAGINIKGELDITKVMKDNKVNEIQEGVYPAKVEISLPTGVKTVDSVVIDIFVEKGE